MSISVCLSDTIAQNDGIPDNWACGLRRCDVLPAPSSASSATGSELMTYLLPNSCTIWSKNLNSCLSPLETTGKSCWFVTSLKNCLNTEDWRNLPSPFQELSEISLQPLDPVLTLLRSAQETLAGHELRDLRVDLLVHRRALQHLLDVSAPPDVQKGLRLAVRPDLLGIFRHPLSA